MCCDCIWGLGFSVVATCRNTRTPFTYIALKPPADDKLT